VDKSCTTGAIAWRYQLSKRRIIYRVVFDSGILRR
jgi:hypothetical protein